MILKSGTDFQHISWLQLHPIDVIEDINDEAEEEENAHTTNCTVIEESEIAKSFTVNIC